MYPLTPVDAAVLTRNHQGIINAVEKFEGRKYNYEPINAVEQRLRLQADAGCDRDDPPAGDVLGAFAASAPSSARCAKAASR